MRKSWLIREGDFLTESGKGFVTAKDVDAALADRLRELTTPQGGLACLAQDADGSVLMLDEDYGNPIYFYKSVAIDAIPIDEILAEYRRILAADPYLRVDSLSVDTSLAGQGVLRVLVKLAEPNGTIREMAVDLDGSMLNIR